MVRLRRAGRNKRGRTLSQGIGDQILQLAHLVAPQAQAGEVVAFDEQAWPAEVLAQARELLEGRR